MMIWYGKYRSDKDPAKMTPVEFRDKFLTKLDMSPEDALKVAKQALKELSTKRK